MATRYIGDAVVTITYRDRGDYAGKICVPLNVTFATSAGRGRRAKKMYCWPFSDLRAAPIGFGPGIAYDSAKAYDAMANAAASFGGYEDRTIADAVGGHGVRRTRNGPVVHDDSSYTAHAANPVSSIWNKYRRR